MGHSDGRGDYGSTEYRTGRHRPSLTVGGTMVLRRWLVSNRSVGSCRRMVIHPHVSCFRPKPLEKKDMDVLHGGLFHPIIFRTLDESGFPVERRVTFSGSGSHSWRSHLSMANRIHAAPFPDYRSSIRRGMVSPALLLRGTGCLGGPKIRFSLPSHLVSTARNPSEHPDSFYFRRPEFTFVRHIIVVGHPMGGRSRSVGSVCASFRFLSSPTDDPLLSLLSARHLSLVHKATLSLAILHHRAMHPLSALYLSLPLRRIDCFRHSARKTRPKLYPLRRLSPPLSAPGLGLSVSRFENLHVRTSLVICRSHALCMFFDVGPHLKQLPYQNPTIGNKNRLVPPPSDNTNPTNY